MHIQDLAGVAHDAIDPSVFSIGGDEQMVGKTNNHINYCALLNECIKPPL